jgi:hypothetical protein
LGQAGPKPKVRHYVPAHGNSWLERVNFVLADSTMEKADAHWLKGLEASGIGAGKMKFTPQQLEAARISEQHVAAQLKEVLPTFTHGGNSLGTRCVCHRHLCWPVGRTACGSLVYAVGQVIRRTVF